MNGFDIENNLPYSMEFEQAALGALLLKPEESLEHAEALTIDAFYNKAHSLIYKTISDLAEGQQPIDLVTVTSNLKEKGELEDIGGVSYLSKLAMGVPTTANAGYYFEQLQDMAIRRELIRTNMLLIQQAAAGTEMSQLMSSVQQAQIKIADRAAPKQDFKRIDDVLIEVVESAEIRSDNFKNGTVTGVQTGFTHLDSITAGLQKSDLIIVAARPSVGKTAFALNVAQNVAIRNTEPVAIFSLEMSAAQLVQRMVCAEGNIDASNMRMGDFASEDWTKFAEAVGILGATNIRIDDSPGITVHEIRAKCRRLKKQEGLGMIVIDYLQLIAGRSGKGAENRQQEVSEISRTLKQLARELDVPVIALSQLSRAVEQRQDKRPMMSDLRESGSIEQDADIVAFLYRDDYYNQESEKKNIIEIIIGKQRNGPVGTVELVFLKQFNKFVNYERTHNDDFGPTPPQQSQQPKDMNKRQWA